MMKKVLGISLIIFAITLFMITTKTTEKVGISNKELAEQSGSVIHSGKQGGVIWKIYENGNLLFLPIKQSEVAGDTGGISEADGPLEDQGLSKNYILGTFADMSYTKDSNSDWHKYKDIVTSISFSPGVRAGKSLSGMFSGFSNVTEIDFTGFDTSNATKMDSMFKGLSKVTELDFSKSANFDTSKVTNMSYMFAGMKELTSLDFSTAANFDTSKVTDMASMFSDSSKLEVLDLSKAANFDTSNVTNMEFMFNGMSGLTELDFSTASNFNTSNVTNMGAMFQSLNSLTRLKFSENFDTSNVTNMSWMFYGLSKLTSLDFSESSNFNTENVTNMRSMFAEMRGLTELDLSKAQNFNTSNATDMGYMFAGMHKLTSLDLSKAQNFDTRKVIDMKSFLLSTNNIKKIVLPENFVFLKSSGQKEDKGSPDLVVPNGYDYTNKWIKEDKSGEPLTVESLYENPENLDGTWVWQEKEKINVTSQVHFDGGYKKLPEQIQLTLYADGKATDAVVTVNKTDIYEGTGNVTADFGDKVKFSDNDESAEITYSANLTTPLDNFTKDSDGNYTYTSPKMDITIEKRWIGGDDNIPYAIEVQLKRDGNDLKVLNLNKNTNWNIVVQDLDKTDKSGKDYVYTIEELTSLEGFKVNINDFVITNVYVVAKRDLKKRIILPESYNGDLLIALIKNGKKTDTIFKISSTQLREADGKVLIKDLLKYDNEGNAYEYDLKVDLLDDSKSGSADVSSDEVSIKPDDPTVGGSTDEETTPEDGGQTGSTDEETTPEDGGQTGSTDEVTTTPKDGGQTGSTDEVTTTPEDGGQTGSTDEVTTPPKDGGQTGSTDEVTTPPKDEGQTGSTDEGTTPKAGADEDKDKEDKKDEETSSNGNGTDSADNGQTGSPNQEKEDSGNGEDSSKQSSKNVENKNNKDEKPLQSDDPFYKNENETQGDDTSSKKLPYAGLGVTVLVILPALIAVAIYNINKLNKLEKSDKLF